MTTCDRCQIQATIQCKECSMMIYSQNGDKLQAMKLCEECDRLLHQISYKANHKRARIGETEKVKSGRDVLGGPSIQEEVYVSEVKV